MTRLCVALIKAERTTVDGVAEVIETCCPHLAAGGSDLCFAHRSMEQAGFRVDRIMDERGK